MHVNFQKSLFCTLLMLWMFSASAQRKGLYIMPSVELGVTPNLEATLLEYAGPYCQPGISVTYMAGEHLGFTTGLGYSWYKYISRSGKNGVPRDVQEASYIELPVAAYVEAEEEMGKRTSGCRQKLGFAFAYNLNGYYNYSNPGNGSAYSPAGGSYGLKENRNEMKPMLFRALGGIGFCHQLTRVVTWQLGWQFSIATTLQAKADATYNRNSSDLKVASLKLGAMIKLGN